VADSIEYLMIPVKQCEPKGWLRRQLFHRCRITQLENDFVNARHFIRFDYSNVGHFFTFGIIEGAAVLFNHR